MPRMNEVKGSNRLIKLLLIGDSKIGKTHYAGMAAEDGFNLLYMDGDVGAQTLSLLSQAAQERIYYMQVGDSIGNGLRAPRFRDLFAEFTTSIKFKWNDDEQRLAKASDNATKWEIVPGRMDESVILVLDSWTALVESIMLHCANQIGVDLSNASTSEMRPVYQSSGIMATAFLQTIRSAPCHVLVIAHPDEFSHTIKPDGRKVKDIKETDLVIDWTKLIPRSTSKPHGMQLGKYFTDVGWLELSPAGDKRVVNFKAKNDRVVGGHFQGVASSDEYSFANLVKLVGGQIPTNHDTDKWLTIIPPGEEKVAESKVLDGTSAQPVKGMAQMFGKKSG